ncbi:MAG: NADH-quinone oxidoreductase subunit G [Alphaproteobacteria bacterium]|nr:NADH-quinone oxidoreductase subunit G [Alphaproteobacteria bacterium]
MPKLKVDGIEVEVPPGSTVLQACEEAGKEIPRFCYHQRLSIAGNCRMCLVEVKPGPPKPQASCALPAMDNQEVFTDSEMVVKARKGVMEMLLINHPLDCPICDQGGECDLQDQALYYGMDHSRYAENKRAVTDKYMGPLIKTIMTRCIHCTRCVRFVDEVAGVPTIGALGRGGDMEITTLEQAVASELSGNVIDLCPVGALTSKPYSFHARPWELTKTQSVDVHDAMGAAIRIDSRSGEVLRVLPRLNEDVNEEWLGDKSRFACDGLKRQRLDRPYVRKDGKLQAASWAEALQTVAAKLKATDPAKVGAIAGDLADCESVFALKGLLDGLGATSMDCRQDGAAVDASCRAGYILNTGLAGIDQADALLLIGTNPRVEAPVWNARIRKAWLDNRLTVGVIGENADLTYDYSYLGAGAQTLQQVADGTHAFAQVLRDAERPLIVIGQGALARPDGAAVLAAARAVAETYAGGRDGFGMLHTAAGRVGALDLGFVPGEGGRDTAGILDGVAGGEIELVFLLGADEIDAARLANAFVVYQGHHGDQGAHAADVILPGAAYTEKDATYVNTEGRPQRGYRAIFPPGDAREDWAIVRALSGALGAPLPFDTLEALRAAMAEAVPHLGAVDRVSEADWGAFGAAGDMSDAPFASPVRSYYHTNPIARASQTMARCIEELQPAATEATGTDG